LLIGGLPSPGAPVSTVMNPQARYDLEIDKDRAIAAQLAPNAPLTLLLHVRLPELRRAFARRSQAANK